jgi:hypothetical protein
MAVERAEHFKPPVHPADRAVEVGVMLTGALVLETPQAPLHLKETTAVRRQETLVLLAGVAVVQVKLDTQEQRTVVPQEPELKPLVEVEPRLLFRVLQYHTLVVAVGHGKVPLILLVALLQAARVAGEMAQQTV